MEESSAENSVNESNETGRLSRGVMQERSVLLPIPLIPVIAYTSGVKGIFIFK